MCTKFGYNMTSNKLFMAKVHVFFEWPSYSLKNFEKNRFFKQTINILKQKYVLENRTMSAVPNLSVFAF
jgi:hypothetical protein